MTDQEAILEAISDVRTMIRDHISAADLHIEPKAWSDFTAQQGRIIDTLEGSPRTRLDGTVERAGGTIADVERLKARNGLIPVRLSKGTQAWIATVAAIVAALAQTVRGLF